jgi:hemolysin III
MSMTQDSLALEKPFTLPSEALTLDTLPAQAHPAWREFHNELANSITHGLGFALSIPAAVYLMLAAYRTGDMWHLAGYVIYALTMMGVYGASTLSHVVHQPKWKDFFRQCDQAAIYLFIAGTFTPFAFNYVRDGFWMMIPISVWAIALSGFVGKMFLAHRIHGVELPVFLFLGWLPILAVPHVSAILPLGALWWMLAGGLCYTAGVWFLKNDYRTWWMHSIWHLLVIAGTALHFVAIVLYVQPLAA